MLIYLYCNGSGTKPDLTLVSSDVADERKREIIYNPDSSYRMIVTSYRNKRITAKHQNCCKNRLNPKKANWRANRRN